MKINGYVTTQKPDKLFAYSLLEGFSEDDIKGSGSTYVEFKSNLYSLDKLTGITHIVFDKEISYGDLPEGLRVSLQMQALSRHIASKNIKQQSKTKFYFSKTNNVLLPDYKGACFVNYGFKIQLVNIAGSTILTIDPRQYVTEQGETWSKEFTEQNYSVLSENRLTYTKFKEVLDAAYILLQSSFKVDTAAGIYEYSIAPVLQDYEIKIVGVEPEVSFGVGQSADWQLLGLKRYGPWDSNTGNSSINQIDVSIIGTGWSKDILGKVLNGDTGARYGFPGFESVFKTKLLGINTNEIIPLEEQELLGCTTKEELIKLLREKARSVPQGRIAVIEIPDSLKKLNLGVDLRDLIKIIFWEERIGSQVINDSTIRLAGNNIVDNLALGIYVSAGGQPWVLEEPLLESVCIGISFGVSNDKRTLTGIFEILDGYGATLEMSLEELTTVSGRDIENRDLHISQDDLAKIIEKAISLYSTSYDGNHPKRIIVHKTTPYNREELKVLSSEIVTKYTSELNFLYVSTYSKGVHLLSEDGRPPTRLMYWQFEDNKAFLYTQGGKPFDPPVPSPIYVEIQAKSENSTYSLDTACEDIIKLTKLNWNSINSYEKEPITLSHSRRLIDLLRCEFSLDKVPNQVRFFL